MGSRRDSGEFSLMDPRCCPRSEQLICTKGIRLYAAGYPARTLQNQGLTRWAAASLSSFQFRAPSIRCMSAATHGRRGHCIRRLAFNGYSLGFLAVAKIWLRVTIIRLDMTIPGGSVVGLSVYG